MDPTESPFPTHTHMNPVTTALPLWTLWLIALGISTWLTVYMGHRDEQPDTRCMRASWWRPSFIGFAQ